LSHPDCYWSSRYSVYEVKTVNRKFSTGMNCSDWSLAFVLLNVFLGHQLRV